MIRTVTTTAAKAFERFVVNKLPYRHTNKNGVVVGRGRLLEYDGEDLRHKAANCDALRLEIKRGDHVVVIGGGVGVSSVVAARATGPYGRVDTYEAASGLAHRVRDTARRNNMDHIVTVHHATVGEFRGGPFSVETFGEPDGDTLHPADLPECDVLFADCEGAEQSILGALAERDDLPRALVVETHDFLGVPTDGTRSILTRLGYDVVHREVTRPDGEGSLLVGELPGAETDRAGVRQPA